MLCCVVLGCVVLSCVVLCCVVLCCVVLCCVVLCCVVLCCVVSCRVVLCCGTQEGKEAQSRPQIITRLFNDPHSAISINNAHHIVDNT